MKLLGKYKLTKDIPGLQAGAVFEHREYQRDRPDMGNPGCGAMVLAYSQQGWSGETFIFPGQLAGDAEWFQPAIEKCPTCNRSCLCHDNPR